MKLKQNYHLKKTDNHKRKDKRKKIQEKEDRKLKDKDEDKKLKVVKEDFKYDDYKELEKDYNFSDYDSDDNAKAIASASLLTKKGTRRKVLDASYNRYAFIYAPNLPAWFVEDERKHFKPQLPITKEMVEKVKRERFDLANKPIKKVHEARMRKKKRLAQRLENAKKKAKAIVENEDLGSLSKSKMIQKLYKKAARKEDKDKVYVVAQKQGKGSKVKNTRNLASRKLKGKRIKLVDNRMKSDQRQTKKNRKKRTRKR